MREEENIYNRREKHYGILTKISVILILLMVIRETLLIFLTLLLPFIFGEDAWLSILIVPFILFVWWGLFPVFKVLWRMLK